MTDDELPLPEPEETPPPHQPEEPPLPAPTTEGRPDPASKFDQVRNSAGAPAPAKSTDTAPDMRQVLTEQLAAEGIRSAGALNSVQGELPPLPEPNERPSAGLAPVDPGGLVEPPEALPSDEPTPEDRVHYRARQERQTRQQRISGTGRGADTFVPYGSDTGGGLPPLPTGGGGNMRGFDADISGLVQVNSQMLEVLGQIHSTLQELLQKDTDARFSE
jgi:hypothetical protein